MKKPSNTNAKHRKSYGSCKLEKQRMGIHWEDGFPTSALKKLAGRLDEEKITSLEQVGMVWDAFSEKWERGFAAAAQYYAEHGNLIMPVTYTTKDGLRLGVWLRNQKQTYANGTLQQEKLRGWKASESGGNRIIMTSSGVKLMQQPSCILKNTEI